MPLGDYQPCRNERLKDQKYYITQEKVFGTERTVVSVYSPNLLEGQLQGIFISLAKTEKLLSLFQQKLKAWKGAKKRGKRPTAAAVEKQVNKILARQHMKTLFNFTIRDVDKEWIDIQYAVNEQALEELKTTTLGKTILFTDRADWEAEDIILTYRDQSRIEHSFRQMKDPSWVSWEPLLHWTDQKIRVHAFYCFTALLMSALVKKELQNQQIFTSLPRAFKKLSKIQEITIEYPPNKRTKEPVHVVMLTDKDKEQE